MKKIFVAIFFAIFFAHAFSVELPRGFGGVLLGMRLDDAKNAIKANSDFGYVGDRDVSLLPGEARVLIETNGQNWQHHGFLTRCTFQFYEENLYSIIINFNEERLDHYSVYSALAKKYGAPQDFSPERALWKNESVTFALERPLSLKYIENKVAESLLQKSTVQKNDFEMLRETFLDEL